MEDSREEQGKKYAKLIAKAWSDASFKEGLLADSRAVLETEGISVPPGVDVKVLEQTEKLNYIVIPKKPSEPLLQGLEARIAAGCCSPFVCSAPWCH